MNDRESNSAAETLASTDNWFDEREGKDVCIKRYEKQRYDAKRDKMVGGQEIFAVGWFAGLLLQINN